MFILNILGAKFRMKLIENDRSRKIVIDSLIGSLNQSTIDEID